MPDVIIVKRVMGWLIVSIKTGGGEPVELHIGHGKISNGSGKLGKGTYCDAETVGMNIALSQWRHGDYTNRR